MNNSFLVAGQAGSATFYQSLKKATRHFIH